MFVTKNAIIFLHSFRLNFFCLGLSRDSKWDIHRAYSNSAYFDFCFSAIGFIAVILRPTRREYRDMCASQFIGQMANIITLT